ncbi:hypothetical protein NBRC116592_01010 [Colwellia sp. KU-HH00111]|uniref:hypothetical protein n=1 Tax=Colwellia sp. KU-HH00111 TaxID=3127652 RepID=UPI0031064576
MQVDNEATMNKIQQLSLTLSTAQLEQFVSVIESLAALLQVANQDTEKAYRMYLNSIQPTEESVTVNRHFNALKHTEITSSPVKH